MAPQSHPKIRHMPRRFSNTVINFWLDACLLVMFLLLCWSSVIVRYVFPSASSSEGWQLWGASYLVWTDIQFGCLCLFAVAVLVHVMMHWTWVCGVVESWYRKRRGAAPKSKETGSRTLWGVGLLIVIFNVLGLGIAIAALSIQGPAS